MGRHDVSAAVLKKSNNCAAGLAVQSKKEKSATMKRLITILAMVMKHEAFDRHSGNCELAGELGAFHDCPVGTNPGPLERKSASHASNQTHRELLECIADAVRERWLGLRRSSPRWSVCCDETSDVSGKSQNAMAAKIVLPDGKTAVPFVGLHEMPRGTSGHLKNTLVRQVLTPILHHLPNIPCLSIHLSLHPLACTNLLAPTFRCLSVWPSVHVDAHACLSTRAASCVWPMIPQMQDGDGFSEEELQAALNEFSADTCFTMFGRLSGLATRLMELFCNLVARKCGNHKGALAASHGCHAIPCLKNHCRP